VPLSEFEQRGVQPAVALRSLVDVGMLHKATQAGPPTTSREVRGVPTIGVVLPVVYVDGLDPLAFTDITDGTDPVT